MITVSRNKKNVLIINNELSFDFLLKQYDKQLVVESQALKVNKLTVEKVEKQGISIDDVIDMIITLTDIINPKKEDRERPILVGHNIDEFDIAFLTKLFKYKNLDLYSYFKRATIDTYTISSWLFSENEMIENLKLITMCNFMGIKIKDAHRAYNDAYANAQFFVKLYETLKIKTRSELFK